MQIQFDPAWFAAVVASLGFLAASLWSSRAQKRIDQLERRVDSLMLYIGGSALKRDGTLPLPGVGDIEAAPPGTRMTELDERGRNPGVYIGRMDDHGHR